MFSSIATDSQGKLLTRTELEMARERYLEVAAALEAAKQLNENAEQLIHDAAEAVYKKFPYFAGQSAVETNAYIDYLINALS